MFNEAVRIEDFGIMVVARVMEHGPGRWTLAVQIEQIEVFSYQTFCVNILMRSSTASVHEERTGTMSDPAGK